jgi:hypothetical protein
MPSKKAFANASAVCSVTAKGGQKPVSSVYTLPLRAAVRPTLKAFRYRLNSAGNFDHKTISRARAVPVSHQQRQTTASNLCRPTPPCIF